jgi:biopolymer transport protein ExbB
MTRHLTLIGLVILFSAGTVFGADSPTVAAAAAKRARAEEQLAAARARIIEERTRLSAQIQEVNKQVDVLRTRLREAQRGRDSAAAELKKRRQEHDRDLAQVRQLADRALIAARLPAEQAKIASRQSPRERVTAAVAGIEGRVNALERKLVAMVAPETVISRNGKMVEVPVLRLGQARAVALGTDHDTRGVLTRAGDGESWLVAGPALPSSVRVESGTVTAVPLDPDDTLPQQRPVQERTLAQWIKGGRFFIWPILAIFALGLGLAIERIIALVRLQVDPRRLLDVARLLHEQKIDDATRLVAEQRTPMDRILAVGLGALDRSREAREAVLDQALLAEAPKLQRGLAFILVMAGVAPLLGLLGTVTGMIDMFGVIAEQGSGNAKSLSGAISEALITTQAGMMAAIPLLLLHAALARRAERRLMVLEEAACSLLGLDHAAPEPATSGAT